MNELYIFGAKYLIILSIILFIWWFFKKVPKSKRKGVVIYSILTFALAFIIAKIAGHFYFDPRPFVQYGFTPLIAHAADNGFPSDHALLVCSIAAIVTCTDIKRSLWFWLVAIIVSISRVGVGVHHPIDVTMSAAIAAVSAYSMYKILKMRRVL